MHVRTVRAALTMALVCLTGLAGCSTEIAPPARVIVVGMDAADWGVMKNILDQGKLPHFSRLLAEGATGRLETFIPLRKSPILWTSIATSKYPDEHGIGGFVKAASSGETVPFTGNTRRVKALWDILGDRGYTVGIVGWMVTWPAEEVNGYLVSDYVQYETENKIKLDKQTYPEELFEEIDPIRVTRADVSDEDFDHLFPAEFTPETHGYAPWQKDYVKMIFATDETFRRAAFHLYEKDVDFLAVYFNGIDSMCHNFWDYWKRPGHPLGCIIDNYYIWMDEVLGQFMELVDDETLLIVCSDHGFYGPRRAKDGSLMLGVQMHGRYGVIGLMGKGVRRGSRIIDAGILDITPTILYALGLPVARDMHGKVLTDGFQAEFMKSRPVEFIATYETGDRVAGEPLSSPVAVSYTHLTLPTN